MTNTKKQIAVRVPDSLYERLQEEIAATEGHLTDIIIAALKLYFSGCDAIGNPEIPLTERENYELLVSTIARVQANYPKFVIPDPRYRYQ